MLFFIVLGIIQGIVEWLPVSSQGVITLITQAWQADMSLNDITRIVLLLHLGTFCAALIYFRQDVQQLLKTLFQFKQASPADQRLFMFLLISTLISGILGLGLQKLLNHYLMIAYQYKMTGPTLTLIIGGLLIITGLLQLNAPKQGKRTPHDLTWKDGVILGITQGCATLPGISRSGSTVSLLLLCGFDKHVALRLSFLMSLPIVLAGNIILNFGHIHLLGQAWWGLIGAFIFGLLTIHLLLKLAERVNFSLFVIGFGLLTLLSVFL